MPTAEALKCSINGFRLSIFGDSIFFFRRMLNLGKSAHPFLFVCSRRRLKVLNGDAEFFGRLNDQLRRQKVFGVEEVGVVVGREEHGGERRLQRELFEFVGRRFGHEQTHRQIAEGPHFLKTKTERIYNCLITKIK